MSDQATVERALRGEQDAVREVLYDLLWQIENRCEVLSDDLCTLELPPATAQYLRQAVGHILDGVPAEIALGLKTGDDRVTSSQGSGKNKLSRNR